MAARVQKALLGHVQQQHGRNEVHGLAVAQPRVAQGIRQQHAPQFSDALSDWKLPLVGKVRRRSFSISTAACHSSSSSTPSAPPSPTASPTASPTPLPSLSLLPSRVAVAASLPATSRTLEGDAPQQQQQQHHHHHHQYHHQPPLPPVAGALWSLVAVGVAAPPPGWLRAASALRVPQQLAVALRFRTLALLSDRSRAEEPHLVAQLGRHPLHG